MIPRALGIDDGHFERREGKTPLIGILMRGSLVEGAVYREIDVDGIDVTEKVLDILFHSKFSSQIRVLFSIGSVFGGTNILDMVRIYNETGVPVISVLRRPPTPEFEKALLRSPQGEEKLRIHRRNPQPTPLETKRGILYVQSIGLDPPSVKRVLEDYQIYSAVPEPVRLAHIVATATTLGDSRGRP